ncbi:hypothetical protein AGMMS49944_27900 [Spirochaetia bacterium]|nr:hypothetical protein AGMMS49944_27900 [Spirochaetia bacterium]
MEKHKRALKDLDIAVSLDPECKMYLKERGLVHYDLNPNSAMIYPVY